MVLNVRADSRMLLDNPAELCFPIAVADDPVDVTASSVCLPAIRPRSGEVHEGGGPRGIIWIEQGLVGRLPNRLFRDSRSTGFTCHIREIAVQDLCGVRVALADQITVEPFLRDPLQLA